MATVNNFTIFIELCAWYNKTVAPIEDVMGLIFFDLQALIIVYSCIEVTTLV